MADTKNSEKARLKSKTGAKRDAGPCHIVPDAVLDCSSYLALSGRATKLLMDMFRQYSGFNNGKLVAVEAYLMGERGWTSKDQIQEALKELTESEPPLLIRTRKGSRGKAAWYMLAWYELDVRSGLDCAVEFFDRTRRDYQGRIAPLVNGKVITPQSGVSEQPQPETKQAINRTFATPQVGVIEEKLPQLAG